MVSAKISHLHGTIRGDPGHVFDAKSSCANRSTFHRSVDAESLVQQVCLLSFRRILSTCCVVLVQQVCVRASCATNQVVTESDIDTVGQLTQPSVTATTHQRIHCPLHLHWIHLAIRRCDLVARSVVPVITSNLSRSSKTKPI